MAEQPRMAKQYYGHFQFKGWVEHVVVQTFGGSITSIIVTTHTTTEVAQLTSEQPTKLHPDKIQIWFTLEPADPDTDRKHGYDETNRLHFKALSLVYNVLIHQSNKDIVAKKWHARIDQKWPPEARLSDEPLY